jgi:predicted transcriptional regulator
MQSIKGYKGMADTTFSVRLPEEVHTLLGSLSKSTNRSKNFLAREAITRFVQSEADIVEGIKRGMADIEAGRVVPHDVVMRQLRATIDRVAGEKKSA